VPAAEIYCIWSQIIRLLRPVRAHLRQKSAKNMTINQINDTKSSIKTIPVSGFMTLSETQCPGLRVKLVFGMKFGFNVKALIEDSKMRDFTTVIPGHPNKPKPRVV
jgi:hypothetical protein